MKAIRTLAALVAMFVFVVPPGWAQTVDDAEHAALAKAEKLD